MIPLNWTDKKPDGRRWRSRGRVPGLSSHETYEGLEGGAADLPGYVWIVRNGQAMSIAQRSLELVEARPPR